MHGSAEKDCAWDLRHRGFVKRQPNNYGDAALARPKPFARPGLGETGQARQSRKHETQAAASPRWKYSIIFVSQHIVSEDRLCGLQTRFPYAGTRCHRWLGRHEKQFHANSIVNGC